MHSHTSQAWNSRELPCELDFEIKPRWQVKQTRSEMGVCASDENHGDMYDEDVSMRVIIIAIMT